MNILEETARIAFSVGLGKSSDVHSICPIVAEAKKPKSTHQPDHAKAEILEMQGNGYRLMWESTGKKCYKDSMEACYADAKDYRSCGFVRPLGATV